MSKVVGAPVYLGLIGAMLAIASIWIPWWGLTYSDQAGMVYAVDNAGFWVGEDFTNPAAVKTSLGMVAIGGFILAFRFVAGSATHEPKAWRRDTTLAAVCLALGALAALAWPTETPGFWGGRTFEVAGASFTEEYGPRLGWWLAAMGAVFAGLARISGRQQPSVSGDEAPSSSEE